MAVEFMILGNRSPTYQDISEYGTSLRGFIYAIVPGIEGYPTRFSHPGKKGGRHLSADEADKIEWDLTVETIPSEEITNATWQAADQQIIHQAAGE